jgi:hypothetical protein
LVVASLAGPRDPNKRDQCKAYSQPVLSALYATPAKSRSESSLLKLAERGEAKDGADGNKEGKPVGPAVTCVPLYGGRARIIHGNPRPKV